MALEVAGEVEVKFTKNMPSFKDGIIVVAKGKTLAKVIKREYQRRYNTLIIKGVRILNNPGLLVIVKKIPTVVSCPEGAMALRRVIIKIIIANKMVMELKEILVKLYKKIKRLKPTPATKNSAYQDF